MFIAIAKEILKGKTLIRTLMNLELKNYTLSGHVLDIGGGNNPSYLRFFKKADGLQFTSIDLAADKKIDLEKELIPYEANSVDQVLLFNILEHIYNHKFLVSEVCRVLKSTGQVIGFVPFLVSYHPDPHDYFRYTQESLERIFKEAGFSNIKIKPIGGGPWFIGYDIVMSYFPRILRLLVWPVYWLLDKIFLLIKPTLAQKFVLGYFFTLEKK